MRRISRILTILGTIASALFAQTTVNWNLASGVTPTTIAPGNPRDVYSLNGFESVDVYRGKVHLAVPLMTIGSRGTPAYTMTAPVEDSSWSFQVSAGASYGGDGSPQFTPYSTAVLWNAGSSGYRALYGPGMLVFKQTANDVLSSCNDGIMWALFTFSQVVFLAPDGTEHPLIDQRGIVGNSCTSLYPPPNYSFQAPARGPVFAAVDGSNLRFV